MPMRKLIGLVRNLVVLIDGVGHGAAIVAWPTYRLDVALAAVNHNDPAFADETSMFSPLCDQFDAGGIHSSLRPAARWLKRGRSSVLGTCRRPPPISRRSDPRYTGRDRMA